MKTIFLDIDETCVYSYPKKSYYNIINNDKPIEFMNPQTKYMKQRHEEIGDRLLHLNVDNGYVVLPRPGLEEFLNRYSDCNIYVLSSAAISGYLDKIIPHYNIPAIDVFSTRKVDRFAQVGIKAGIFDNSTNSFISNNWCLIDDNLPYDRQLGMKFHVIGVPITKYNTAGFQDDDYQWCRIDPWYGGPDNNVLNLKSKVLNATIRMYLTTDD